MPSGSACPVLPPYPSLTIGACDGLMEVALGQSVNRSSSLAGPLVGISNHVCCQVHQKRNLDKTEMPSCSDVMLKTCTGSWYVFK